MEGYYNGCSLRINEHDDFYINHRTDSIMAKQLNPLFMIELQDHSFTGDLETEKEWFKAWLYDHAEFRNKIDKNIGMPGNLLYDADQKLAVEGSRGLQQFAWSTALSGLLKLENNKMRVAH